MCTGNLRSATETLFHYIHTKNIFMIKRVYSIMLLLYSLYLSYFRNFLQKFRGKINTNMFFILAVAFGIMFINKDDSFNEN